MYSLLNLQLCVKMSSIKMIMLLLLIMIMMICIIMPVKIIAVNKTVNCLSRLPKWVDILPNDVRSPLCIRPPCRTTQDLYQRIIHRLAKVTIKIMMMMMIRWVLWQAHTIAAEVRYCRLTHPYTIKKYTSNETQMKIKLNKNSIK